MIFPAKGLRILSLPSYLTLKFNLHNLKGLTLFLGILFLAFSCPGPAESAESMVSSLTNSPESITSQESNLLFLPLKINSPSDAVQLEAHTDDSYMEVLHSRGLTMVGREETDKKLGSSASLPPSFKDLATFAASGKADYVAAGSLTRYGNRISVDITLTDLLDEKATTFYFGEAQSAEELKGVLDKIVGKILAYTGRYFLIDDIKISGNKRIDSGAILRQVKSRAGDGYDRDQLKKDLKTIFGMGYFDDVQILVKESEKGKQITFKVQERPVIGKIVISGNKELDQEEIREVVTVSSGSIINNKQVSTSEQNILHLYRDKGFYNTTIKSELGYPTGDSVDIHLTIKEGSKIYIKEVNFVGNLHFKTKALKKTIETSKKGWLSWITDSGMLKKDALERDAARIAIFYRNNGFVNAQVGKPEVTQKEEWLYITFNISEGERYRVGTIDISGDLITDKNELIGLVKLRREKYYSSEILRKDILRLTDYYAEKGYAFAEINPSMQRDESNHRVDLSLGILKKELVHVNRILIKGNTRTRDKVIRREIVLKEGEIFDATAMRKSQQKLQYLDFFEDIIISPEPGVDEGTMDINIEVKEKPTGSFSIGAGYSSVDSMLFMAEVKQHNFLGKGQQLAFQVNLSGNSSRYNIGFTEPHWNDTKLLAGFDLYSVERDYDDYTKDSNGFSLRFAYPVWRRWVLGAKYGWDDTDLMDVDREMASIEILDSMDIHVTSYVRMTMREDTRNRRYGPSKGHIHSLAVKYAGGILGGDSAFTKFEGYTSWFFPTTETTVFHIKGGAGHVTENSYGKLPVYEKFYLGGLSNLRGFKSREVSPRDPKTGEKIGGNTMWYMNVEWIFPLSQEIGLKGLVFFDCGSVFGESDEDDSNDLKKSVGFGFRWISPLGPLRLEWGYNIDPEDDEDQSNWDFSIGGEF